MESVKVISNSSPLINLSKINKLDLLEKLYGQILIPNAVYEELVLKGDFPSDIEKIEDQIYKNIIKVKKVKDLNFVRALNKDLDKVNLKSLPWQLKKMLLWLS